jgi:hypothetical protein
MNFLTDLTDIGLRRVYKFVLKRLLGKYLYDEIILEQISVNSRDGKVSLCDLNFDPTVLNEDIPPDIPFEFVSLFVNRLEATISYRNILSESCVFSADEVLIVLRNVDTTVVRQCCSQPFGSAADSSDKNIDRGDPVSSAEGESGLSFIAHWMEAIISRLQVRIGTVKVQVQNEMIDSSIHVTVDSIVFFNGESQEISSTSASSLQYSASLMVNSSLKSKFLSQSRKVCFSSICYSPLSLICS